MNEGMRVKGGTTFRVILTCRRSMRNWRCMKYYNFEHATVHSAWNVVHQLQYFHIGESVGIQT